MGNNNLNFYKIYSIVIDKYYYTILESDLQDNLVSKSNYFCNHQIIKLEKEILQT